LRTSPPIAVEWTPSTVTEQTPQSDESRERIRDHIGRDPLHIPAVSTLRLESLAKRGLRERVDELRHDTARDVHAAERADAERHVARDRSEHRKEHRARLACERLALLGEGSDVVRRRCRCTAARP